MCLLSIATNFFFPSCSLLVRLLSFLTFLSYFPFPYRLCFFQELIWCLFFPKTTSYFFFFLFICLTCYTLIFFVVVKAPSPPLSNALKLIIFTLSRRFPPSLSFAFSKLVFSSSQAFKITTKDGNKEFSHSFLVVKGHTPSSSHTCGRIVLPCLNHLIWWDRVHVIKTPPSTFTPLRFDNDLSSPLMSACWDGIPLIIHGFSSSKMVCKQYMPMVVNPKYYVISGSTIISISSLPSMAALGSRIVLLVGFVLLLSL